MTTGASTGDQGQKLRARYFALLGSSDARAHAELRAAFEGFDPPPTTTLRGLSLCEVPSQRFCQLRLLEAELLGTSVRERFVRPRADMPELAAVFLDPQELAFHSFDHIIGLDHRFAGLTPRQLKLGELQPRAEGIWTSTLTPNKKLNARLHELDALDIYLPPINASSRGGKRCIFHSERLAEVLGGKLRRALPEPLRDGFEHVNPVFRLNRFEPGDARFARHVDAPFSDPRLQLVSKYTLLWYLGGGQGRRVLDIAKRLRLDEIDAWTLVLFEQRLAHEGGPFESGPKLFLRTELIYTAKQLPQHRHIASLFAKACYLDGESVFAPELARFAHAAHDRAAAAHWQSPSDTPAIAPLVCKAFRGVRFVTNGYDYWFRAGRLPTIECAALSLLDVLNARLGDSAFRKQCTARTLLTERVSEAWIASLLDDAGDAEQLGEPPFARLDRSGKRALLPEPELPERWMDFPTSPDFSPDPFPDDWDATRNPRVVAEYERVCKQVEGRLFGAPILLLGQELFLDPDRFVIAGDKIHVLSDRALGPVHYAGAVFYSPGDFVEVNLRFEDLQPIVPPIQFHEGERLLHLSFDLFRNGWMVDAGQGSLLLPRIEDDGDMTPDMEPYAGAVRRTSSDE